jgi:hypothetical protein
MVTDIHRNEYLSIERDFVRAAITSAIAFSALALTLGSAMPAQAVENHNYQCGTPVQLGPESRVAACLMRSGSYVKVRAVLYNDAGNARLLRASDFGATQVNQSFKCPLAYYTPDTIGVNPHTFGTIDSNWCYVGSTAAVVGIVKGVDPALSSATRYVNTPAG